MVFLCVADLSLQTCVFYGSCCLEKRSYAVEDGLSGFLFWELLKVKKRNERNRKGFHSCLTLVCLTGMTQQSLQRGRASLPVRSEAFVTVKFVILRWNHKCSMFKYYKNGNKTRMYNHSILTFCSLKKLNTKMLLQCLVKYRTASMFPTHQAVCILLKPFQRPTFLIHLKKQLFNEK